MGKLPRGLSGLQVVRALEKVGFEVSRQKGSHIVMYRDDPKARVVVPNHSEVRIGTLAKILTEANLTAEELTTLIKE